MTTSRRWWLVGLQAAFAVAALALVTAANNGDVLVLGTVVVRPAWLALLAALAAVVLGLARRAPTPHTPVTQTLAAVVAWGFAATAVVAGTWVALAGLGTRYTVLTPVSPGGCRILLEQESFITARANYSAVPPGALMPRKPAQEGEEDGGTYRVTWQGETATIDISSRLAEPITVTCE